MISLRHRLALGVTSAAFGLGALTAHMPEARADEVSPTGKGIAGGALLGGEVVMITGGLIGIKSPWFYVVGGIVGAAGGGIGGYFIEQADGTSGHVPVYLLGGGLLGVIPAVVLALNATRYQPPENTKEDKAPTDSRAADPGSNGTSSVGAASIDTNGKVAPAPAPAPSPAAPPQSLLDVNEGAFRVGVPFPQVKSLYTLAQQKELGVGQGFELRMPVVKVAF